MNILSILHLITVVNNAQNESKKITTSNSCPIEDYCLNGGTCTIVTEQDSQVLRCSCPPGFVGLRCQIITDICETKSCSNRGLCSRINTSESGYECYCNGNHFTQIKHFNS